MNIKKRTIINKQTIKFLLKKNQQETKKKNQQTILKNLQNLYSEKKRIITYWISSKSCMSLLFYASQDLTLDQSMHEILGSTLNTIVNKKKIDNIFYEMNEIAYRQSNSSLVVHMLLMHWCY
jgi:Mg/Co/Ni transporter MgtE